MRAKSSKGANEGQIIQEVAQVLNKQSYTTKTWNSDWKKFKLSKNQEISNGWAQQRQIIQDVGQALKKISPRTTFSDSNCKGFKLRKNHEKQLRVKGGVKSNKRANEGQIITDVTQVLNKKSATTKNWNSDGKRFKLSKNHEISCGGAKQYFNLF